MSKRNNVPTRSHCTSPFPSATVNQKQRLLTVTAEPLMAHLAGIKLPSPIRLAASSRLAKSELLVLSLLVLAPLAAHAQGSPFDTGFNAIQALFTGTIAKVASLVAIVIGGHGFAHGEPRRKKGAGRTNRVFKSPHKPLPSRPTAPSPTQLQRRGERGWGSREKSRLGVTRPRPGAHTREMRARLGCVFLTGR